MTNNIKVFVSYSHRDEEHREDLIEHLAMLQRKEVIDVWHDRKISASEDWKNQIDENLEKADLIIFLVSPSFLASSYCQDVEVKRAMERDATGSARIVSVVVRPCDWNDCEFARYQATPKDATPITEWANKDKAWLDVVKQLKSLISELRPKTAPATVTVAHTSEPTLSAATTSWMEDTDVLLSHRRRDQVNLSDIFVFPDLEIESSDRTKEIQILDALEVLKEQRCHLISGEEQQGKTALLKQLYKKYCSEGIAALYINAKEIRTSNLNELIEKHLQQQYVNLDIPTFLALESRLLLIDDLDNVGLNNKYRSILLQEINSTFDWVIATCHTAFNYVSTEISELSQYQTAEILGLGHLKRERIAKKWISLGVEESIDETDLYAQCDEIKSRLDSVIKKNIVPTKPIYILMIIQMFEAYSKQNIELTSYGHCYQHLIYQSLQNAKVSPADWEKYLNVLTEISWEIHINGESLNDNALDLFFEKYHKQYLTVDRKTVIANLVNHSILTEKGTGLNFRYPYIYYFFVAKKIAEGYLSSNQVRLEVEGLLTKLHREDAANILVFITHHSREPWVTDKIQSVLRDLFENHTTAALTTEQLRFMEEFAKQIPELVVEHREVQKNRDDHHKKLDELEREDEQDDIDAPDILININKTFKGMEIAGQIIRNRHGTLTRDALLDLAQSGSSAGLRFLDYFLSISDTAKQEVIEMVERHLSDNPSLTNVQIQDHARKIYSHLIFGVVNGVIQKIASSIGSKEASEIYDTLKKSENTPAHVLLRQAIDLRFSRKLDFRELSASTEDLRSNPVCMRILREMVVQHIYMFPVSYKEKQKLSELMSIPVRGQQLLDRRKQGKGA